MRIRETERPPKIKFHIPSGSAYTRLKTIQNLNLHTICAEALCPNIGECSGRGEAAFLILGDTCTRNCLYCAVKHGIPHPIDEKEPQRLAIAAASLNMRHVVITSPTRDDLEDGGASQFAITTKKLREKLPHCTVELLVPDFAECMESAVNIISSAKPDVLNHNIEVTRNLFQELRPMGNYDLSLALLSYAASIGNTVKSGLMVGVGESINDVLETLNDLRKTGCSGITVGQYLPPNKESFTAKKYYTESEFDFIKQEALHMGFTAVYAGTHIRSSYNAANMLTPKHKA